VLVGVDEKRRALPLRNLHRHDLVAEAPFLDGAPGAALAFKGKRILLFARDFAAA
jgi:hypothetical protein